MEKLINSKRGVFLTALTLFIFINLLSVPTIYREKAKTDLADHTLLHNSLMMRMQTDVLSWQAFKAMGGETLSMTSVNGQNTYIVAGDFSYGGSFVGSYLYDRVSELPFIGMVASYDLFPDASVRMRTNESRIAIAPEFFQIILNESDIDYIAINATIDRDLSGSPLFFGSGGLQVVLRITDNTSTTHTTSANVDFSTNFSGTYAGSDALVHFRGYTDPAGFTIEAEGDLGTLTITSFELRLEDATTWMMFDNNFELESKSLVSRGLYLFR